MLKAQVVAVWDHEPRTLLKTVSSFVGRNPRSNLVVKGVPASGRWCTTAARADPMAHVSVQGVLREVQLHVTD
jgi:hypothetical protein